MSGFVPVEIVAMVSFNLTKYQILLMKKFTKSLGSSTIYKNKHTKAKNLQWKELFKEPLFN